MAILASPDVGVRGRPLLRTVRFASDVPIFSAFETCSLPTLTRSYPRRFTSYVAHPIRSILYFNNPVDYMANQSDPWYLHQYASCDIRLVTGCGPWENSGPTYRMSEILRNRGIAHHLDDWGPEGGHDWPYWHHQMWEYVGQHY